MSLKYNDPECPTITCVIGWININKALPDLGAIVNLLSYFVCKQLGLWELKPNLVTLQLADRSEQLKTYLCRLVISISLWTLFLLILHCQKHSSLDPIYSQMSILVGANAVINC